MANRSSIDASATHLLHRAVQRAGDLFATSFDRSEITPRQFAVLAEVRRNEGLKQADLVERTGIDRSTMADIVRRLLEKGMLQRKRSKEDGRAYAVKLTAMGVRALDKAEPAAKKADQMLLAALKPALRKPFLESLKELATAEHDTPAPAKPAMRAKPAPKRNGKS
jgi:DNA-binding MarR family transcriptional regulator